MSRSERPTDTILPPPPTTTDVPGTESGSASASSLPCPSVSSSPANSASAAAYGAAHGVALRHAVAPAVAGGHRQPLAVVLALGLALLVALQRRHEHGVALRVAFSQPYLLRHKDARGHAHPLRREVALRDVLCFRVALGVRVAAAHGLALERRLRIRPALGLRAALRLRVVPGAGLFFKLRLLELRRLRVGHAQRAAKCHHLGERLLFGLRFRGALPLPERRALLFALWLRLGDGLAL